MDLKNETKLALEELLLAHKEYIIAEIAGGVLAPKLKKDLVKKLAHVLGLIDQI